ncbi:fumarylacetoacetase [uncultured Hymenobacter sp.]|uniref:fumarylacetoacetase n=1 Tax=uncultured Hymenobacter sp. TaxID=170016 RepID=UPI0035CABF49
MLTDPALRSWIDIAPGHPFPLQNLPFGVFEREATAGAPGTGPRLGVAIGSYVLDLYAVQQQGFFDGVGLLAGLPPKVLRRRSLNRFIGLGRPVWRAVRQRLSELLRHDNPELRDHEDAVRACLLRQTDVQLLQPIKPRNYTDFYSSIEHATNVGSMFRDPANALLPNWRHLPVAYHGRASSIVVSGTPICRPQGQRKAPDAEAPTFGPSQQLDFELEVGFVVGKGTTLGSPVPIAEAEDHIFGVLLFNDWSARDLQSWEYAPLGPFLGKNFGSSVSPWVVTMDALEPFRVPGPAQLPTPLPYLQVPGPHHFDLQLEVALLPAGATEEVVISQTNFRHLYWSMAQQLAHHASNGCNLEVGDLYASGTISGPTPDSLGSMLELAWRGTRPLPLPDGSERSFLLDGDTVIMRGYGELSNGVRIGFGEVRGMVLAGL